MSDDALMALAATDLAARIRDRDEAVDAVLDRTERTAAGGGSCDPPPCVSHLMEPVPAQ